MTSLIDIIGYYVAIEDADDAGGGVVNVDDAGSAGSDGGIIEMDDASEDAGINEVVDGASEDGAFAFSTRAAPAAATPEGTSGPTCDGDVINVDDASEDGALAFGTRAFPAWATPGGRGIDIDVGAGAASGGGAAATPESTGDPTRNVDAESDARVPMTSETVSVLIKKDLVLLCKASVWVCYLLPGIVYTR